MRMRLTKNQVRVAFRDQTVSYTCMQSLVFSYFNDVGLPTFAARATSMKF